MPNNLLTNLVAYWGTSSGKVDVTGNITDLTENNSPDVTTSGVVDKSTTFVAASSQSLTHASVAGLQLGAQDWSISTWVKFTSIPARVLILGKTDGGTVEYALDIEDPGGGYKLRAWAAAGFRRYLDTLGTISTATWYHVVFTYKHSTTTLSVYGNGGAADTTTGTVEAANTLDFGIGRWGSVTSNYMNGQIGPTGIWTKTLDATDVSNLYNSGSGLAYSSFDNGSSTSIPVIMNQLRNQGIS